MLYCGVEMGKRNGHIDWLWLISPLLGELVILVVIACFMIGHFDSLFSETYLDFGLSGSDSEEF